MKKRYLIDSLVAEFSHKAASSRAYISSYRQSAPKDAGLREKMRMAWGLLETVPEYDAETRHRILYHEAGHALVAYTLAHKVHYMTTRPSISGGGYVSHDPPPNETYMDVVENIAMAEAGMQAEKIIFGNCFPQPEGPERSDTAQIFSLSNEYARLNPDFPEINLRLAGARLAKHILQDNLPALYALADRAKVKAIIPGSEIADIIDAARAKTAAKPASPSL